MEGKSPNEIEKLRILDPACGSGSFLLKAYQVLLDHHLRWYAEHSGTGNGKISNRIYKSGDGWQLTTAEKKRILLNNIYGVDIDRQAVEVTKLSLLLKALEGENEETLNTQLRLFKERALPNLDQNIKCGNSLIGTDYFSGRMFKDEDEVKRVNPFDWDGKNGFPQIMKAGRFDCVIGNPPYIDSEWMTRWKPTWRTYCNAHYKSARGNWDIFCIFVEKALKLCNSTGLSSMIVPNKIFSADYAGALRSLLSKEYCILVFRDYSNVRVFPVAVYPIVYVATRETTRPRMTLVEKMQSRQDVPEVVDAKEFEWRKLVERDGESWSSILARDADDLVASIRRNTEPLGEIAEVSSAATVAEAYNYKELIAEYDSRVRHYFIFVNTGTIDRYSILWGERPTTYIKSRFKRPVIPESKWSELSPRRLRQAQSAKVIVGGMTRVLECTYDSGEVIAGKSTVVIFSDSDRLKVLLGILNSRLLTYYYSSVFAGLTLAGGFLRIGAPQLRKLPIRKMDLSEPADKARYERMVALVEQMLELQESLRDSKTQADRDLVQRQIDATDRQIDALVYDVYGLTDEEIKIVEDTVATTKQKRLVSD